MERDKWNQRYAATGYVWSVEANRFVVAELASLTPGRALDIAAGEGRNAVWLAERGWRVTAVDFSDVGLSKGKQLATVRGVDVEWVLADVVEYQPPAASFELVLLCYLHLPAVQRRQVLAHARQALTPGGTFFYVGHDLSNLERGWGGPQDPAVLCTPDDIVADLPGLVIERAEVVMRPVALEPGHGGAQGGRALDALVRARRPLGE